ncbi:MAG: ArsC/Spx/MgsR family protein [Planctomycetota bacterium]|nr:ArsC/Spx/MgsR family protein [Planctomycetota bacterium]
MVFESAPEAAERRYKKEPFTKRELTDLMKAMDDWTSAINTRHKIAKENGWADKPPSRTAFVAAALEEPNLLRRPIIQRGTKAIYSRKGDEIRAFLK